jgi:hypothetical protein
LFEEAGIPVLHFIEPQDMDKYNVPNKICIGKNDQGIAFVRNFILDYAKEKEHEWILLCDDDVNSFGIYNGKTTKKDANIWLQIFEKVNKMPFELVGINYVQHAWHEKQNYSVNRKFTEVCLLLHVSKIWWRYRSEFNLKEDRDFVLQTIKNGNGVLRFNRYWFGCPGVGSNPGGLADQYKQKKDEESAKKMCIEWHPFVTLKNKSGRIDMKADIKALASKYQKTIK